MYSHILVPTHGSRVSEEAASAAIALARSLGARLTALHVVPPPASPPLESWAHGNQDFNVNFNRARERRGVLYLEAIRDAAMFAGVACECALAHDASPSGAIVREARSRNCDLVVMGSHGRRGPGGLAGSETLKVVAFGGIPVLAHHAAWPSAAGVRPPRAA